MRRMFTYAELAWVVMLILSAAIRITSALLLPCGMNLLIQEPFVGANTDEAIVRTSTVARAEMMPAAVLWQESRYFLGLAFFLHLFIFLKFLVHFANLGTLIRTLEAAGTELASFSISFLVIFMAFVTMFYTLFSLQTTEFNSFLRSVSSLWLGMLGELQVTDQMWTRKEWAVPMVIIFTFISVFVLLTLIVAIISNAHERIRIQEDAKLLREQTLLKDVIDGIHGWQQKRKIAPNGGSGSDEMPLVTEEGTTTGSLSPVRRGITRWKERALKRREENKTDPFQTNTDATYEAAV